MDPTPHIALISYGAFENHYLIRIAEAIRQEFGLPVEVHEARADLTGFFDPGRRQYHGNKILKMVEESAMPGAVKTIGLFSVDLFIPILTYIFGQAYLNGPCGIASRYRLSNDRYGMPNDDEMLLGRMIREVIHETGHTFGLIHCHTPACVMQSSTYVEDIDQKEPWLCASCRKQLAERV